MKIATHNGPFHCDDVFAVAVLLKLYPDAEIVRTRDESVMDECDIVVDVGKIYDHEKGRYDHHQLGRGGQRSNDVFYSGLGLVWKHYGLEWCAGDERVRDYIDESFVQYVDAEDNGQDVHTLNDFQISPVTVGDIVQLFKPNYGEVQDFDACFIEAVKFAGLVMGMLDARARGSIKSEDIVRQKYAESADPRLFIADEFIPLGKLPEEAPELLFHIYPDTNNNWAIKVIKKEKGSFEARKNLPTSWAGLNGEELAAVTGVKDSVFCHNALFIAVTKSKASTLVLAKLALDD